DDPDRAAALDFRDLSHQRSDGARRARNNDSFSRLWPAYFQKAEIRRQPGYAKDVEGGGDRQARRVDLAQRFGRRNRVFLPPEHAFHPFVRSVTRVVGLDHASHDFSEDDLAYLHRTSRGTAAVEPSAHIGVHREIERLDQYLPSCRPRYLRFG